MMGIAAIGIAVMAFGQAITSSISGTVSDSSGAAVPGAIVTISDASQGVERKVTANSTGSYLVAGLPAGTYDLKVVAAGFRAYVATGITVHSAEQIRADATLQVGTVSTSVTVATGCYAGANNSAGDPSCIASDTFLHATGAHDPRIMQFGLKLFSK